MTKPTCYQAKNSTKFERQYKSAKTVQDGAQSWPDHLGEAERCFGEGVDSGHIMWEHFQKHRKNGRP